MAAALLHQLESIRAPEAPLPVCAVDSEPVQESDLSYIRRCLKDPAIVDGEWRSVDRADSECGYRWTARYGVRRQGPGFELRMSIDFVKTPGIDERDLARFRKALDCAQRTWATNGLPLVVTARVLDRAPARREADHQVELHSSLEYADTEKWMTHTRWSSKRSSPTVLTTEHLCSTYAHEIGHFLGLADEYPDAEGCPGRKAGDPGSLMYSGGWADADLLAVKNSHWRRIIAPLCAAPRRAAAGRAGR